MVRDVTPDLLKPNHNRKEKNMKTQVVSVCFAILLLISSCAVPKVARTGRLYNLANGNVMETVIEDARQVHGMIRAINRQTGENFEGEYNSVRNDVVSGTYGMKQTNTSVFGTGASAPLSLSSYGWATAYGFSFNERTKIYGAATLVGNKGTVIEVVYAVDRHSLHGYGVGRDNRGGHYKMHF